MLKKIPKKLGYKFNNLQKKIIITTIINTVILISTGAKSLWVMLAFSPRNKTTKHLPFLFKHSRNEIRKHFFRNFQVKHFNT
jgi:hypothetical protein